MMIATQTAQPSLLPWQSVELKLPLTPGQRHVLRAVAASIAMREEFTMDVVTDLELVVDEIYAALAEIAAPIALLRCEFSSSYDGLSVHAYTFVEPGADLPSGSVGEYVLATLARDVHSWRAKSPDGELDLWHIEATVPRPVACETP